MVSSFHFSEYLDINQNTTAYSYTPLGNLEAITIKGKGEGDSYRPSTQFKYNLMSFKNTDGKEPIYLLTSKYIHHDAERRTF